jgi:hypothetical protein
VLIVVLFGFLNIKSVKIYAIPFIVWTTLLLYKLYILLLKQKNLPVLDIKGFFFRIRGQRAFDSRLYLDISRSFKWKESLIFRYFKVFQVSQMFTCGLSDLLLLAVGSLVVFVLREYILKVHILVSSEHKLYQIWNTCIVSCILLFLNKLLIFFLTKLTIKSSNTKTTNEPTASNNKSDRPQVNIWDTWKTLKYLNINDSFHLKDLEISKYKRESKARWPIKMC